MNVKSLSLKLDPRTQDDEHDEDFHGDDGQCDDCRTLAYSFCT